MLIPLVRLCTQAAPMLVYSPTRSLRLLRVMTVIVSLSEILHVGNMIESTTVLTSGRRNMRLAFPRGYFWLCRYIYHSNLPTMGFHLQQNLVIPSPINAVYCRVRDNVSNKVSQFFSQCSRLQWPSKCIYKY